MEAVLDAAEEDELWANEQPEEVEVDSLANLPAELLVEAQIPMASFNDVAKFASKLVKHARSEEAPAKVKPEGRSRQASIQVSERTMSVCTDILDEEGIVASIVQKIVSDSPVAAPGGDRGP